MPSYHKEPHIKKLNPKDPAATNKTKTATIGGRLTLSGNAVIAATGSGVSGGSTTLDGSITTNANAKIDSITATKNLGTSNKGAVKLANDAAVIVEQQLPNNPDAWIALGYEVTMELVPDTVLPGMAENCSVSQGDADGTADVHHDPVEGADDYQVWVTNGAPGIRAGYIDVTNYEDSTGKSSSTVTLSAAYLGVPLNWIIVARNSKGSGNDSVPFGGGKKIN